jgi:2-dehydro-3-deoxyphosphogalactonate aldolase
MDLNTALSELPLVAILRGIRPDEVEPVSDALYCAGFRVIEVPLNSPTPFDSISRLVRHLGDQVIVGAGTVLSIQASREVESAGGRLIVMPHTDRGLIADVKMRGLYCIPGSATPSEVFACLDAGADAVKLFPAELIRPGALKAIRSVVPKEKRLFPVGGITPDSMGEFRAAGASGFGLGSALYAPGMSAQDVSVRAFAFVSAWHSLTAKATHG